MLNKFFRIAIITGVENSVRLHIERGDDINARDINGLTPLMIAALKNKAEICELLLSAGADPFLVDSTGRDAEYISKTSNSKETLIVFENFLARNNKNNLDKKALIPNKLTKIKMTSPNHLCKEILVLQL